MPVSADTTQIAIVEEVSYGVTPATPVFLVLPITADSLVAAANTELSQTLNSNRQRVDSFLTSININGGMDFEFAKSPAMTLLLESAMGAPITENGLDREHLVGIEQISFTVEKRWPDPNNAGQYLYHRYPGCVSNTMVLNLTAGAAVTGSVGLIGQSAITDTVELAGATYEVYETTAFRGPDVKQIVIDNESGTLAPTLTDSCVTDITININNNYRGIQCLGTLGNKETVIGSFDCNYDQTIFFSSNDMMDGFLDQDEINEIVTVGDSAGDDYYMFITTRGKFASNDVVAGGTGTDVVNANTVNWLLDNDLANPTTLAIQTSEGAGAASYQSAEVGLVNATSLVITYDKNMAVTDGTGFTVDVNGGTPNVVVSASAATNTITLVLTDAIINTDTVLVSYDGLGNATNADDATAASTFVNRLVVNNV